MKKIYLVYTSNSRIYPYFPSSSLAIATPLVKAGYDPVIIDTELVDWKNVDFSDTLFVAISTFTGYWLKTAVKVARKVRDTNPDIPVFWGGPHAIDLPELTAKHELADAVCYGEGENVILELARAAESGGKNYSGIKGIMYRDEAGNVIKNEPAPRVNMNGVELPDYKLLNLDLYPIKKGRVYYQSSRGCVFKCRFCSCEKGLNWKGMSAEKVLEDLEKIVKFFEPEEVQFFDGNFFVLVERVKEILKTKIERGYTFRWSAFCRFDTFTKMKDDMVELMAKSGCAELKFGGEAGTLKILKYIRKETRPEMIYEGVRRCVKYGITPTLSFMTGFPPETLEDMEETLKIINTLKKEFPMLAINGLFLLQHLPNTSLTEEVMQNYKLKRPENLEGWIKYDPVWTKRSDYPWMSRREYVIRRTLSSITSYNYLSSVLLNLPLAQRQGTPFRSPVIFNLFKFSDRLIRFFVWLRYEKRIIFFPVEWLLWDKIRRYVLRTC